MNRTRPYSVLLLEDEAPTRDYLAALIEADPNLTLLKATATCAEARAAFAQCKPDVLVADIGLPDGSGIDIIQEASTVYPDLEAMVITVLGDEENVIKALEAGATGYLLKEQAFDILGDSILALMQGETAISPKVARFLLKRFNQTTLPKSVPTPQPDSEPHILTSREQEVLQHIARGFSYHDIGIALELSTNTIRAHIRNIYRKLAVKSRSEAVFEATQLGLITMEKREKR